MPEKSVVLRGIALTVLFCALAELAAFVALVGFDMVRGRKLLPAISGRAFMHPLAPKSVVTVPPLPKLLSSVPSGL